MLEGKRILALIPARGGSKGIKDKNIRDLNGKPLIAYTIEAAINSKYVDDVVLSTDSERIADVAHKFGAKVPFMRPDELASDKAKSIDAVIHAIKTLENQDNHFDILVFLQPTSPLRTSEDIDEAIEKFMANNEEGLVSVSPVEDHPILIRTIGDDGKVVRILNMSSTCRRQDMPAYYRVNGAIYIFKTSELNLNTSMNDAPIPYVMERSHSVDIDALSDFYLADYLLKNEVNKK